MSQPLHALVYEYVDDIVDRRGPHRDAHITFVQQAYEEGLILMGAGLGSPAHSGLLVIPGDDPEATARYFAEQDPYQQAGLVARWRLEPMALATPSPWEG